MHSNTTAETAHGATTSAPSNGSSHMEQMLHYMPLTSVMMSFIPHMVYGVLMSILAVVKWVLMRPFHYISVDEPVLTRAIDIAIIHGGWSSNMQFVGLTKTPGNGIHFFAIGGRWFFAQRYYTRDNKGQHVLYQMYSMRSLDTLPELLLAGDGVFEIWFEPAANPWYTRNAEMRCVPLPSTTPFPWQLELATELLTDYQDNTKGGFIDHASALIWGETGAGKSTFASYLASMMKATLSVSPVIIRGFNATTQGIDFSVLENIMRRTAKTPVILVLDEWDKMVEHALKQREAGNPTCYAQDKANLCNFRDRLETLRYVIVIATTNIDPPKPEDDKGPFFRAESFRRRRAVQRTVPENKSASQKGPAGKRGKQAKRAKKHD